LADVISTRADEHARSVVTINIRELTVSVRRCDLFLVLICAFGAAGGLPAGFVPFGFDPFGFVPRARAAVSPEDAARLGTTLTPMGGERAGNADGSIPAWTGGNTALSAPESGSRPDPFAGERSLFSITESNLPRYAARIPEGAKALFAKYPDYRMDVYPTHRTAAAPQAVYDAILRNATAARAAPEGITSGIAGAAGGIPFPIPRDGAEAMWNHELAFWGVARETRLVTYVVFGGQPPELTDDRREVVDFPYYYPNATPSSVGPYYLERREAIVGPPEHAGERYVALQPLNVVRDKFAAWQYLPGQRRVRRSPSLSYDTPNPEASGLESFDDYYIFSGGLDRYRYTLVGKREMYVPYNNNRLLNLPPSDLLTPRVANPADLRYELHRVWVVDATLAPGQHDIVPHRRLYLDEDTWFAVYADAWDRDGRLWKFSHGSMVAIAELPAVVLGPQFVYDLQYGAYVFDFAFSGAPDGYRVTPPHPADTFTPEGLAASGTR
jgi:hypothetical protein